jgi:hypothetical protein
MDKTVEREWHWWAKGCISAQTPKSNLTGLVYQGGQLEFGGGAKAGRKRKKPPRKSDNMFMLENYLICR